MVALFGVLSTLGFFVCIVLTIINAIKKKPVKPYAIGIGVCFVLFIVCIAITPDSETETTKQDVAVTETKEETANKIEDNATTEVVEDTTTTEVVEDTTTTEVVEENTSSEDDSKEALKEEIKDKEGLVWFGDVRNDTTGNWRLSEYASSDTLETFAVDYYNAFFEDDAEIHAVINMSTKVTGKITKLMDDTLDVTLYEYVDGEEHDAKELFGGMKLKEYFVTISTGEIETIE